MTQPNIVLVVMDTARVDTAYDRAVAPELSALAEEGTRFENCFSSAPWTLPSHASLFTGCTPSKTGAHAGHKRLEGQRLQTLAEALGDDGYETVGVSNNTWISEEFGLARGFETFYKTWQYTQTATDFGGIARRHEGVEKYRRVAGKLFEGSPLTNLLNVTYGRFFRKRNDDGAARTNEWISKWLRNRRDDRPFFLFVNYLEPHLEYRPPREYAIRFLPDGVSYNEAMAVPQDAWSFIAGRSELTELEFEMLRALYQAELAYVDEKVGELRRMLETSCGSNETMFAVTADHGENIGDHGLMDHQYCLYDTLIHVPLLLYGGSFADGTDTDALVQLTDIAPTLLDIAGVDGSGLRKQAQGRSFHPDSCSDDRELVHAEYLSPQPSMNALRERVGELPPNVLQYDRSIRAIRNREWKLVRGSDGARELYRVSVDPDESKNLADGAPEVVRHLEARLDEWLASFEHADTTGGVSMSDETRARLENLGYLQ